MYGSGEAGRTDGVGQHAQFHSPQGLVWHNDALYVADTENHLIRKVGGVGGVWNQCKDIAGVALHPIVPV